MDSGGVADVDGAEDVVDSEGYGTVKEDTWYIVFWNAGEGTLYRVFCNRNFRSQFCKINSVTQKCFNKVQLDSFGPRVYA